MTSQTKNQLKSTLHLPQTTFPMRANLAQREPESLARWAASPAPQPRGEPFVLHDGPPYANGDLHLGHLLNRCLKDFVVRSQRALGRPATLTPGWDCHGLPIAQKVLPRHQGATAPAQRAACRSYASEQVQRQATQMRRLLADADYDRPYRTMDPDFASGALEVLAELVAGGYVTRRTRPVHWSPTHRSALAEAEVEHREREDTSLFVRFPAEDTARLCAAFGAAPTAQAPSWVAWTTTPWSLPANLALALHPDATYQLVLLGGVPHVLAAERVEAVAAAAGVPVGSVLGEATGRALAGLRYRHPLLSQPPADGAWRVVCAAHVSLSDGSGVVHTAPGHGADDHRLGLREGLPAYCPVDDAGRYTDDVPGWLAGQGVWAAEPALLERLEAAGAVLHRARLRHSYPHAARSKTPVLFRATPQWFVQLDVPGPDGRTLRAASLDALGAVTFHPPQSRNRLTTMVASRPDWCLSRQRTWGLPLPAFFGPDGRPFLTAASARAVAAAFAEDGTDAWYRDDPATLLRHYDPGADPDRPAWLAVSTLEKGADVLDVWFESGASWHAAHQRRGGALPADLYLEGSDQHRGWFQLSLLTAVGVTGRAPYRHLLTHGFVVDADKRKLSKSRGVGTMTAQAAVSRFGAEVCRWWVAGLSPEHDVKVSEALLQDAKRRYRRVRNTLRFLLGNLDGPAPDAGPLPPTSLDAWVRAEFDQLSCAVRADYAAFQFAQATARLQRFCSHTLSAVYFRAAKDRLYCDRADAPRRRHALHTLTLLADGLCRLLAPLLPHTADDAWRHLHGDGESVHGHPLPSATSTQADPAWEALFAVRGEGLAAVEAKLTDPLDAGVVLPDPSGVLSRLGAEDLADVLGVSRARPDPSAASVVVEDLRDQPRCERSWKRHATVRRRDSGLMLSDRDAAAISPSPTRPRS